MLTGLDEIHEQIIEVERVLCERLVQRRSRFDVCLDRQHQLLPRRFVVAVADDVEALHHWDAGLQHRRQLTCEQRDVLGRDLLPALEELHFLAHLLGEHALTAQVGFDLRFRHREHLALDALAPLVRAFPDERKLLCGCELCHLYFLRCCSQQIVLCSGYSTVHWLTSSRLVIPALTFSRPERRKSQMPSAAACAAISTALPPWRMMRWISSETGMTW